MRWLLSHDFKQENAHENIKFLAMLLQLQRYTALHYMGTWVHYMARQALKAGQLLSILRYCTDKISQSVHYVTKARALPLEGFD